MFMIDSLVQLEVKGSFVRLTDIFKNKIRSSLDSSPISITEENISAPLYSIKLNGSRHIYTDDNQEWLVKDNDKIIIKKTIDLKWNDALLNIQTPYDNNHTTKCDNKVCSVKQLSKDHNEWYKVSHPEVILMTSIVNIVK